MFDFIKITAALPGLVAFRPKIWYENKNARKKIRGGALVIANHFGFTDPMVLQYCIWYRRHHFICLKTFFERPVSAWFFRAFHCIPVDREHFGMDTLRDIVAHLKNEELVSMFPEGHMSTDSAHIDSFKSGMVLMAAMSRKPIVPVYIVPRKSVWHRQHMVVGCPLDVAAEYGSMPSLPDMETIAVRLREQELRLAKIPNERRNHKRCKP